jgi:hypothetical protein
MRFHAFHMDARVRDAGFDLDHFEKALCRNGLSNQQPAYRAFTVIKCEGQDDYWLPIGAAFPHQSGDGYNIVLQALPIPDRDGQCKIVLRPPKDEGDDTDRAQQTIRAENDRRKSTRR